MNEHNCLECSLREACLPSGLSDQETELLNQAMVHRRQVPKRETLFRAGDPLKNLHMVSSGVFKTVVINQDGTTQVTGFPVQGAVLGLEALNREQHGYDCIAMTDAVVCEIEFATYEKLIGLIPNIGHHFIKLMAREIEREEALMLILGGLKADEKVARFLTHWVEQAASEPTAQTLLPMTREDLGSYLGLTIETVSRTFSNLKEQGLLEVHGRNIEIKDLGKLKQLAH